ncbi:MAG: SMC-Scp complex subunit ScpB [Candidatus Poribacteria bacterium]|nr:SMC-Scp complex subunit ScpB [Candidatus Poribacteria bacterium]
MDLENVATEHLMNNSDVMPNENLKSILEAILFAASEPISVKQFQHAIPNITVREIRKALSELRDEYQQMNRSFHLIEIANGYQICTRPEFSDWIRKFYIQQVRVTLSPSALETLAIVAYKQPVTRSDVSTIRGVNSDSVINALVEKNLVCVSGRKEGAGRSLLFSTTDTFLQQFGLKDPSELPSLEEIEQLLPTANNIEHLSAIQEDIE